ncbi:MAG: glycosyltransferase [Leptolyngbyaceae cyanobacterium SM2_3_12]|nr:glycosyltransferase [Leptolyngbyaceae cyanobacterium SM2_3_12]
MQIVVLENEPSSRRGGQELSLYDVTQELARRGHSITLLYTQPGNLLASYQTFCQSTLQVSPYRLGQQPWLIQGVNTWKDLSQIAPDHNRIIYCNQYQDSLLGRLLAQLRGGKLVCHLRLPPPTKVGWQAGLGLKGAQRLMAVSHYTRQQWEATGFSQAPVDTVHNGINSQTFGQPQLDKATPAPAAGVAHPWPLDWLCRATRPGEGAGNLNPGL